MVFEDLLQFLPGGRFIRKLLRSLAVALFAVRGRVPWSFGYYSYRSDYISTIFSNPDLMDRFLNSEDLPQGFGLGIDERCVEYPWVLSRLSQGHQRILDAGSTLNHRFILNLPQMQDRSLHILTLSPETRNYWYRGISYLYHDLRAIPIQDGFYHLVVCISTLEHVGFDNTRYTGSQRDLEYQPGDYLTVMGELSRVLEPGGELLLTVPFGRIDRVDKFRVFDPPALQNAVAAFDPASTEIVYYQYHSTGWQLSTAVAARDALFAAWKIGAGPGRFSPSLMPPDKAVAARAVACLRLKKKG